MNKLITIVCLVVLQPALAFGQEQSQKTKARGYGFISPGIGISSGSSRGILHFGGGGEAGLYKGLGIGVELGYLAPFECMNMGVGVLSLNGLYYFERGKARVAPYVTGGYSLFFRSGHVNAVNFGGGIDYWFRQKIGLRLGFHDHFSPQYFGDHLIQGRFGIVFR